MIDKMSVNTNYINCKVNYGSCSNDFSSGSGNELDSEKLSFSVGEVI